MSCITKFITKFYTLPVPQFSFIHSSILTLTYFPPWFCCKQFHLGIQQQHLPPNTQHPPWWSFLLEEKLSPKFQISRAPLVRHFAVCLKNRFLCFISNPFVPQVKKRFKNLNLLRFRKLNQKSDVCNKKVPPLAGPTRREVWEVSSPIYQAVKVEGPSFPTGRASQSFQLQHSAWKSLWPTRRTQNLMWILGRIPNSWEVSKNPISDIGLAYIWAIYYKSLT